MNLRYQRRMAASLLKCGTNRVWFDPDHLEDVRESITRNDVRMRIREGIIQKAQARGTSRARAEHRKRQRRAGRQRGHGRRKGAQHARLPRKERWMRTVCALRTLLRTLRDTKDITPKVYRQFYMRVKGGMFKSKAQLLMHLRLSGLIRERRAEREPPEATVNE